MHRYLKDLTVGETHKSRESVITKEDIITFAKQFDPQPMHTSEIEAEKTFFKTLVASGWHMTAFTMRLMVDAAPFGETPLIGAKINEIKFSSKILPETSIYCRSEITDIKEVSNRPYGHVVMKVDTMDSKTDDLLVTQEWTVVVPTA